VHEARPDISSAHGRHFDIIVVGGGVTGLGVAVDAATRGLSCLLVEKDDLGSGTSSKSSKLIHGGLRYAPHVVWPLKFVLPYEKGLRPVWLLRLGLFIYDHLARRKWLESSRMVSLRGNAFGVPLRASFNMGFTYADCWVDDSRFVVLNAVDARARGATISVGAPLVEAARRQDLWVARLASGEEIAARALVNAGGPWVSDILSRALHVRSRKHVRLVKGSHLVLRRLYAGDHAYILQNPDGRIVFAIPYEGDFTLIGTTDVAHSGAPGVVEISDAETDYLLDSVNHFLARPVTRAEIVGSYAGLRPLYDDGAVTASVVTRDYAFDLDAPEKGAPVLSIFGGKITTARRLAEHALDDLRAFLPAHDGAWTDAATLPGGEESFEDFLAQLKRDKSFLSDALAHRLARAYGMRALRFLQGAQDMRDLGRDFGAELTEAELNCLIENEWARTADDILWRRSKLGLHMSDADQDALRAFIGA